MKKKSNKKCDCVWIGIGVDISKKTELYENIVGANDFLAKKYDAKKGFVGSEHPHLNLYDLSVPIENLEAIVEKVGKIANAQRKFIAKAGAIECFPFGLFFLKINSNDKLEKLHKNIVKNIVKFKGECIDKDYADIGREYTVRQKELLREYGNPHVLDQFYPHVTVGHIKSAKNDLVAAQKDLIKQVFATELKIDNVYVVAELNEGKKILGRFDFRN